MLTKSKIIIIVLACLGGAALTALLALTVFFWSFDHFSQDVIEQEARVQSTPATLSDRYGCELILDADS